MKTFFKTLAGATLMLSALTLQANTVKWDMANEYGDKTPHADGDRMFAKLVEERTNGDIKVTLHFGASLGFRSKDQLDAVADGVVPLANTLAGPLAGVDPIFQLSGLPFVARDFESAWVLHQAGLKAYNEVLSKYNQTLLWASPWSSTAIWAEKAINSSADMEGVKVRTYDELGTITLKELGAVAMQVSWADVVSQLSTGGLNAVLTSVEAGNGAQFHELVTHYNAIKFGVPLSIVTINNDTLNSLTEEQRKTVLDTAKEVEEYLWGVVAERSAANIEVARKNGVEIIDSFSQEFEDDMVRAGEIAVQTWLQRTGKTGETILNEYKASISK